MGVDLLRDGLLRVGEAPESTDESELERWAERARQLGQERAPREGAVPMAPTCSTCLERPSTLVCLQCRKSVCATDSWVMLGLCRTCLLPEQMRKARAPTTSRPDLGIKWVEE